VFVDFSTLPFSTTADGAPQISSVVAEHASNASVVSQHAGAVATTADGAPQISSLVAEHASNASVVSQHAGAVATTADGRCPRL
jgi:hypothetical protein